MINRSDLLKDLQRELPKIEQDILGYSELKPELAEHLQKEYEKAQVAGRTAEHFVAWREAQITQAAVAWILTCVFVRFLEDNNLLVEPMLSGPANNEKVDKPLEHAKERMVAYFNENPTLEERDYLLSLFSELERFPVIAELLDHRHNPLWQIPISSDGAKALIDFFQKIDADSGEIIHDFTDTDWDTRFLGDLYQDLSEAVRKRYALLQTPEFVESFILDYTLEKAKDTFGLPGLRLIDPTCGSGHFLLTTFDRMFDAWQKREPATNTRELAQRALDVVHGVDINPYAIAICRFRLFIAAMKAAGSHKVKDAPNFHFNLACGDSLLHGPRFEWQGQGQQTDLIDEDPIKHVLEVEDKGKLLKILGQQYHAVVGNPPYITVKDKALNDAYRVKYNTCYRQYSLGVPFTERFFDLAKSSNGEIGYVGLITANSFMKREFGKKLIESYLPTKDVTGIIDSSGAFIPGHGTPTLILFGRNQPANSATIRSVMGITGESALDDSLGYGWVWQSILNGFDKPGFENEYISVDDRLRESFAKHPWSLEGGGSEELTSMILKACSLTLIDVVSEVGFGAVTREDDVYLISKGAARRNGVPDKNILPLVIGENIRGWSINSPEGSVWPYEQSSLNADFSSPGTLKYLWSYKTQLSNRVAYGKTQLERGLAWFEYSMFFKKRYRIAPSISVAFVATNNHFALDLGGKVFKQSAPIIKCLFDTAIEDYLVLLGLLNSSVCGFWSRQVFHSKRGDGAGKWGEFLEFDGTKLKRFPIPAPLDELVVENDRLLSGYTQIQGLAKQIDTLAQELSKCLPKSVLEAPDGHDVEQLLEAAQNKANNIRAQMVSLQEELDWLCYQAYGLLDEEFVFDGELPPVQVGERAFEIKLARELTNNGGSNAWFTRHRAIQTTEIPSDWPESYKTLIEKRLAVMESDRFIKLIEKPEFKRRWVSLEWEKQEQDALRSWLSIFLEKAIFDKQLPKLLTCAQLVDSINRDKLAKSVAQRYTGNDLFEAQPLVEQLIADDSLPQMAAGRLKSAAIKKFRAWQETWDKQRQEDTIDAEFGVDHTLSEEDEIDDEIVAAYEIAKVKAAGKKAALVGDIPIPPKYAAGDFRRPSYWSLRGKLDVPKERFFSLPGCEKGGDSTLVIGWAGMNHLQRAKAIATWYLDRKETDGWEADKLKPMLVAIDELIPWLKQWHNEIDPEFGERMGDYYEGFLLDEMRMLDVTKDDLLAWEPVTIPKKKVVPKKRTTMKVNDINTSKEPG
jgi:type I restriction-modification system DNA methylase subunit